MEEIGGRPYKYKDLNEFNKKVEEYFKECDSKMVVTEKTIFIKPYTVTGLCLYLDICRDTLIEYEKREGFVDTIKRAKNRIENNIEENSLNGILNSTVSIFNLKNNFGWKDKTEVDSNVNAKFNITLEEYLKEVSDTDEY